MARMFGTARSTANPPLAWNDIEILPVYAALVMGVVFLGMLLSELSASLQVSTLKVIGVVGCLALRHAWMRMDEDQRPGSAF